MHNKVSKAHLKVLTFTLLYAVFAFVLSCSHELWRDEVATFSLVTESRTLAELWAQLKYYGHPGLWHMLLYCVYQVIPRPEILKAVNLLVCVLAVYLFLKKAPLGWGYKVLLISGFFPLYLYPAFSRNYGISMLLIFAFCIFYKDRWKNPIPLALTLFLLANCHAHSLVIACAAGLALLYERLTCTSGRDMAHGRKDPLVIILTGLILGVGVSLLQIMPASDAIMFKTDRLTMIHVLKSAIKAVVTPGTFVHNIFGFESLYFVNVVVFVMYVYLWLRNKSLLVFFAAGVTGLYMFSSIFFPSDDMRHQGAFYLLSVMVFWLNAQGREAPDRTKNPGGRGQLVAFSAKAVVTILLVIQTVMAALAINEEILRPYSSAESLAVMVRRDPFLKGAIILGVPDSFLETLPYYLDNPLYFLSEERFAKLRHLKKSGRMEYHLTDVLDTARELHAEYGKPVIILLGKNVDDRGPYSFRISYQKKFSYSAGELRQFLTQTVLLADLNEAISDENYRVYLLKT